MASISPFLQSCWLGDRTPSVDTRPEHWGHDALLEQRSASPKEEKNCLQGAPRLLGRPSVCLWEGPGDVGGRRTHINTKTPGPRDVLLSVNPHPPKPAFIIQPPNFCWEEASQPERWPLYSPGPLWLPPVRPPGRLGLPGSILSSLAIPGPSEPISLPSQLLPSHPSPRLPP